MPSTIRAKEFLHHHSKPQTAVTNWIDRICDSKRKLSEDEINGSIIQLVESINLQPKGPQEASRAIRKQLKHGLPSQQLLSLIILDALVLNGGDRFKTTFADSKLVECFKLIVADPRNDVILRRRLLKMMRDWETNYGSDPNMIVPAGLFKSCGGQEKLSKLSSTSSNGSTTTPPSSSNPISPTSPTESSRLSSIFSKAVLTGTNPASISSDVSTPLSAQTANDHETKKRMKNRKNRFKSSIDQRYRTDLVLPTSSSIAELREFDLSKERPRILETIATASQAANNLVNRLQFIDPRQIGTDPTIESLVDKLKVSQKPLIRYIQTVSEFDVEGEYIGTLLNTNSQVVAGLELYETLSGSSKLSAEGPRHGQQANEATNGSGTTIRPGLSNIFDDMNSAMDCRGGESNHNTLVEDLIGLDFSPLSVSTAEAATLPAPLLPDHPAGTDPHRDSHYDPGTLSDFSDFDGEDEDGTSDQDTPETSASLSPPKASSTPLVSHNNPFLKFLDQAHSQTSPPAPDPFADPFADHVNLSSRNPPRLASPNGLGSSS